MIIVEGPDGGGKTHLVNTLLEHFDFPLAPKAYTGDVTPLRDIREWIEDNAAAGFRRMIFDRFAYISGPIYAPIMADRYQLNIYDDFYWMSKVAYQLYEKTRPLIIYCLPPQRIVSANVRDDPTNTKVVGLTQQLYAAYCTRAALDMGRSSCFVYDYTNPKHLPNLLAFIVSVIEFREAA